MAEQSANPVRPFVRGMARTRPPAIQQPIRTLRLAALPTAPHMARVFVSHSARQFRMTEEHGETAKLLVSELVTNAVRETGRVVGSPLPMPAELVAVVVVRLKLLHGALRIDVWDNDSTPPKTEAPTADDERGRGLLLVEALASRWGTYPIASPHTAGKVVWAEVAR